MARKTLEERNKEAAEKRAAVEARLIAITRAKNAEIMRSRLAFGLGLYQTCGRCGGGGSYSYCQMHGSTCFGCWGSGKVPPKYTEELVAEAEARVAAGMLEKYLEDLRARREGEAFVKRARDEAWAIRSALPSVVADKRPHWADPDTRPARERMVDWFAHGIAQIIDRHIFMFNVGIPRKSAADHVFAFHREAIRILIEELKRSEETVAEFLEGATREIDDDKLRWAALSLARNTAKRVGCY